MSISLKEFIKNHRDDINSQSFEEIYDELNSSFLPAVDVGKFTELLYTCGVDPLEHLSKIPDFYAYKSRFQSIVIPNNIISIGKGAFEDCVSLTSITIPDSVTSISNYAFSGCTELKTINYAGSKEQWNSISKASNWNFNMTNYTIHCTDGDITL